MKKENHETETLLTIRSGDPGVWHEAQIWGKLGSRIYLDVGRDLGDNGGSKYVCGMRLNNQEVSDLVDLLTRHLKAATDAKYKGKES